MNLGTTPELKLLVAAVIIGLLHLIWGTAASSGGARDLVWLLGPRDEERPLGGVPARLVRAYANYLETFPLYVAAVLAAVLAGRTGELTLWGSWLYVVSRVIYTPVYAVGWPGVRTFVWGASMFGIVLIISAFFM
jgi:uncharacterized MAPEG superfamily protein